MTSFHPNKRLLPTFRVHPFRKWKEAVITYNHERSKIKYAKVSTQPTTLKNNRILARQKKVLAIPGNE